jgi:hypothetical protein
MNQGELTLSTTRTSHRDIIAHLRGALAGVHFSSLRLGCPRSSRNQPENQRAHDMNGQPCILNCRIRLVMAISGLASIGRYPVEDGCIVRGDQAPLFSIGYERT